MARDFDLGNHRHITTAGVFHDLAHVVLCVESAVPRSVSLVAARITGRFAAPGADLRQERVFLDLDAPALIFGQMPVEHILFVHGHQVDELLDRLLRHEITADVEHHPAIGKMRLVFDPAAGGLPTHALGTRIAVNGRRKQLTERLNAVESAVGGGSLHQHLVGNDRQAVGLAAEPGNLPQHDAAAGIDGSGQEFTAGRQRRLRGEIAGDLPEQRVPGLDHEGGGVFQRKRAFSRDDSFGRRNDPVAGLFGFCRSQRREGQQNRYEFFHGISFLGSIILRAPSRPFRGRPAHSWPASGPKAGRVP